MRTANSEAHSLYIFHPGCAIGSFDCEIDDGGWKEKGAHAPRFLYASRASCGPRNAAWVEGKTGAIEPILCGAEYRWWTRSVKLQDR